MYAYAFVLWDNQVCVYKHTGAKLLFVCLESPSKDFWADFVERYNIEPNKHKDFVFLWHVEKHHSSDNPLAFLQNPYFKEQLEKTMWDRVHMRELLDTLDRQHHIRASLVDSKGRSLEGGDVLLHTNANLAEAKKETPMRTNPTSPKTNRDLSEWQKDQMRQSARYSGKQIQKEIAPKPRETPHKHQIKGGDQAPNADEHNH
ncbi:hypothetical protein HHE03_02880 [Helicobacter heilmannii]|uniref:hypothetical protein n=1 Tax=Helicobacter heilmannii TaxID=35817 RepID=UPI0006A17024|nr:hypothetical protein [Helicobacter heilmannii]CRF48714.1 hypothetical protein HHE03_02880 [Helicobacter heilmannii]